MGKYSSKLYHKGQSRHSSVMGGIFTIAFVFVFIVYLITELRSLFLRKNITINAREHYDQELFTLKNTIKMGQLPDLFVLTV